MTADILRKIVAEKWREIEARKSVCDLREIEKRAAESGPVRGFGQRLLERKVNRLPAVIAEIKKASPSKGVIRENFVPAEIARSYAEAGATCLSVLTDVKFFCGADEFLQSARGVVDLPVLRKDFIVDTYQVFEARAINADCILLIVSILDDAALRHLYGLAKDLSMDVLIEVHDAEELQRALAIEPDLLGINNRDLRTFEVSLQTTFDLMGELDPSVLLVTESGIRNKEDVSKMLEKGIYGFLVGDAFMREADPGKKLKEMFA